MSFKELRQDKFNLGGIEMKNILYTVGLKIIVKGLIVWSMMLYKGVKNATLTKVDKDWSTKKLKAIDKVDNLIIWKVYELLGKGYVSADNKRMLRKQLSLVNLYLGHTQEILYVA